MDGMDSAINEITETSCLCQSGYTLIASFFHLDFKFSVLVPNTFDSHVYLNITFWVCFHFEVGGNTLVRVAVVMVYDKRIFVEIYIFPIYRKVIGGGGGSSL